MPTKARHRLKNFLRGSVLALAAGIIVAAFYIRLPLADAQVAGVSLSGEISGPQNVRLSGILSYRVTVKNEGTVALASYQLEDVVPTGLTFQTSGSTAGCTPSGGSVFCTGVDLDPNETDTFRLRFKFTENNQCSCECDLILNSVVVNGSLTLGPWTTQLICEKATADVGITKTGPASVIFGEDFSYTLTVKNNSAQEADSVVVTDKLPTGISFVAVAGVDCNFGARNELICDIPSLAANQQIPITVNVHTDLPAAGKRCADRTIRNTAKVKSGSRDSFSSNNTSSIATKLLCPRADISVIKTGPISVTRGIPVTYVIHIDNRGPATARAVVMKDKLPREFTFISATGANCSFVKDEVRCDIPVLPIGRQSISINVVAPVKDEKCATKRFKNTATITVTSVIDQNKADNTSKLEGEILCTPLTIADLSIAKQGPSTATAFRGGSFFYKITVKNLGPGNATNVIVEDRIPDGLIFLASFDTVCSNVGSIVRCNIGNLSKGESKQFRILFSAPPIERCNEVQISNVATVHADQIDRKPKNNTTKNIITKLKCPKHRLDIKKTDDRTTVAACETLTYKITVKNQGGIPANEVTVVDTFPSYLRPVRASDRGQIIGQTVVWERLSLHSHATKNLTFVAEVRSDTPQKTVITNFVTTGAKRASDKTTVKGTCRSSSSSRSRTPVERLNESVDEIVLPPTGAETEFFAPATNGKQFLVKVEENVRPITKNNPEKGLAVYAVISLAILAIAVGIGLFLKTKK